MKTKNHTSLISIISIISIISPISVSAQPHQWTLRECCDYAVEHNIQIKQQDNKRRQQEIELSTARNARLPDLNGSLGQNFSFGRGLTAENTYSNTNTSSTSFQLGTSVPLFTGFQIPNQIQLNQLNLEAAIQDLEKAKNDIRMQVAQAYVQILYDMEIADVAQRQIEIDSMQVARLEAFVRNGKASEAELSQQRSTLANSRLTATQALNNCRINVLTLTQLLELPSPEGFSIVGTGSFETVAVHTGKLSGKDTNSAHSALFVSSIFNRTVLKGHTGNVTFKNTKHTCILVITFYFQIFD